MEWFERARELAAQQKIAHEKIAERIGRGRSTVSGWLAGEREPKLQEMALLAKVLGVTPQFLIFGDPDQYNNSQIMPYSDVIEIPIFEGNTKTDKVVLVPQGINYNSIAYILTKDSGCDVAPAGATIVIDPSIQPENQDFVFAKANGQASVYRFVAISGRKFLGVDDQRIPFIEVGNNAEIIGVVVFITRKLK